MRLGLLDSRLPASRSFPPQSKPYSIGSRLTGAINWQRDLLSQESIDLVNPGGFAFPPDWVRWLRGSGGWSAPSPSPPRSSVTRRRRNAGSEPRAEDHADGKCEQEQHRPVSSSRCIWVGNAREGRKHGRDAGCQHGSYLPSSCRFVMPGASSFAHEPLV